MAPRADKPTITMADVARRAGTSTAVVSYVMNDGPRAVAAATRERVLAAAAELGYRPNRIARALRSRTTGVVGLILADSPNPYFGDLARHVERALDERDRLVLIGNAGYSAERQRRLVDRFLAAQVDALVIVSADGGEDVTPQAEAAGVPIVYVHHGPDGGRAPLVEADNQHAAQEAVEHLRGHGHARIAFLSGTHDGGPVGRRRAAWQALAGDDPDALLLRCAYTRADADVLIRRLADDDAVPRALITATDEQAIGILSGAWASGIAVPDELALISLDGTPESAHTAPALTVTRQPLRAMAEHAVELVFDPAFHAPAARAPLVVRRSCGC
ncbi:LacI family DNA-binding transcriptional regulator [Nonomuraea wenchangensis]|nr:LacI family DNA-binding transcriptional regulator [Nonomuraea wenchangensis]